MTATLTLQVTMLIILIFIVRIVRWIIIVLTIIITIIIFFSLRWGPNYCRPICWVRPHQCSYSSHSIRCTLKTLFLPHSYLLSIFLLLPSSLSLICFLLPFLHFFISQNNHICVSGHLSINENVILLLIPIYSFISSGWWCNHSFLYTLLLTLNPPLPKILQYQTKLVSDFWSLSNSNSLAVSLFP